MTTSVDELSRFEAFEAFEAEGWERQAEGYDALLSRLTERSAVPLLDAAGVGPGSRVLDVASGPGAVAGMAARRGAVVTGVDLSRAMVDIARHRWPAVTFHQADAHDLPYPRGSFGAVTANFALPHFGRPERAVAEMARVLAPGGRVAVTSWDRPERAVVFGVVPEALAACGVAPPPDLPVAPPFFRFADEDELSALLTGAGLAEVSVATLAFTHRIADAAELWDTIVRGTVRTAALVAGLPAPVRDRVRHAFAGILERFRGDGGIDVPVAVRLATGRVAPPTTA